MPQLRVVVSSVREAVDCVPVVDTADGAGASAASVPVDNWDPWVGRPLNDLTWAEVMRQMLLAWAQHDTGKVLSAAHEPDDTLEGPPPPLPPAFAFGSEVLGWFSGSGSEEVRREL